jgi:transcriptional regulator with XRE-family HTH domain
MPPKPFVRTLRAQWLGQELRRLREARDMTLHMVSHHLRRDMSALSRYERGEWPIGRADVLALLDLYGFHEATERERMLRLAEEVWRTDHWNENYGDVVHASFIDFPWLESRAQRVCSYHAMLIPGLFQLRDYAEVLMRGAEGGTLSEETIQGGMRLRLERQRLLHGPDGPQFELMIEESALRRPIVGAELHRKQLHHVVACAALPRVTMRVLPNAVGMHAGLEGRFWLFQMPAPYPAVTYLEYIGGHLYLESPKSDRYVRAYEELCRVALDPQRSAAFVTALAEEST